MVIEPIAGYRLHQSIKLTLCSPKFNMFKNGLVKINPATFDKRRDRYLYRNITSKLNSKEVSYYFLANCLAGNNYSLANFSGEGLQNYKDFIKRKDSLSYNFENELSNAALEVDNLAEIFDLSNNNVPLIVSYYLGGIVSLETLCLIQLHCFDVLGLEYSDYIWNTKKEFIKKVLLFFEAGFFKYDGGKIKAIYENLF
jgi:hypothetical protein